MNIEAFILCYNEEKMIRHTLNYYSRICSKITVIDNESTDRSMAIIKKHYPKVMIESFSSHGEYREDLQMEIRNNCWRASKADFVIVCDMDEFLYADDLASQLRLSKRKKVAIPVVIGYEMVSSKFPATYSKPLTDQVKFGFRNYRFDKSILFNPEAVKDMNYAEGSHYCMPVFKNSVANCLVEFKLLHYKYLSREYLYEKHKKVVKRMSEKNKENNYGTHYMKGKKFIDAAFDKADNYMYRIID